ncbi:replication termination factor 2-like [Dendroctonus ponderosae]|uniref:Replication termination factor 2 domain-containing protein 1 n=1 Tax=Dendroctonus ponderosae TaxID=77166 RepID=U4UPQ7_DENPD|nr:replication termination factor 2-like [Dendroctonus ponderosae]ERL94473.1 hypothetical protein D910_11750 [Dendroctonus ponderosae]
MGTLWRCCAISQQLLQEPVVTCHLVKLYNKRALIELFLDRRLLPAEFKHIKSLQDVKDRRQDRGPIRPSRISLHLSCVKIGNEWTIPVCGYVFSERSYRELATKLCPKCNKPFNANEIVILNPSSEEDIVLMRTRIVVRQASNKKLEIRMEKSSYTATETAGKCTPNALNQQSRKLSH